MSSGSYLTIYRKNNKKVADEILNTVKNEYYLRNKADDFSENKSEEDLRNDIPLFLDADFKSDSEVDGADKSDVYYMADGTICKKLLDFHFGSSFVCLKEEFHLDSYKFNRNSSVISKPEAEKMLQAVEYVLNEKYDRQFELVLNNNYVEMFGDGYSPFDRRFAKLHDSLFIEKVSNGYSIEFIDPYVEHERNESDAWIKCNLTTLRAGLLAYLNAEEYTYYGQDLILEYSVY